MLTAINFAQRSVDINCKPDTSGGSLSFCKGKSHWKFISQGDYSTVPVTLLKCQLLIALHCKHAKSVSALQTQVSTVVIMLRCLGHTCSYTIGYVLSTHINKPAWLPRWCIGDAGPNPARDTKFFFHLRDVCQKPLNLFCTFLFKSEMSHVVDIHDKPLFV